MKGSIFAILLPLNLALSIVSTAVTLFTPLSILNRTYSKTVVALNVPRLDKGGKAFKHQKSKKIIGAYIFETTEI